MGDYQTPDERLHMLRFLFLVEGSRLNPEMVTELQSAAEHYRHLYESHPRFPTPRWSERLMHIPQFSVAADCPAAHRPLREALRTWAHRWRLDSTDEFPAWVVEILSATFYAWMAGRPKRFHACFHTGSPPHWKPHDETFDAYIIRTNPSHRYQKTASIPSEHLTWAAQRHFGQLPYEQISQGGHVRTVVAGLLREIGLGKRPGRPRRNKYQN